MLFLGRQVEWECQELLVVELPVEVVEVVEVVEELVLLVLHQFSQLPSLALIVDPLT